MVFLPMERMRCSSDHGVNARKAKPYRATWLVLAQATLCLSGALTSLVTLPRDSLEESNDNTSSTLQSNTLSVTAHMDSNNTTKRRNRQKKKAWLPRKQQQALPTTQPREAWPALGKTNDSEPRVFTNGGSNPSRTSKSYSDCARGPSSCTSKPDNRDFSSFTTCSRRRSRQWTRQARLGFSKKQTCNSSDSETRSLSVPSVDEPRASPHLKLDSVLLEPATNQPAPQHQSKSTTSPSAGQNSNEDSGCPQPPSVQPSNSIERSATFGTDPTDAAEGWRIIRRPTVPSKVSQHCGNEWEPSTSALKPAATEQNTYGSESSTLPYSPFGVQGHEPNKSSVASTNTPDSVFENRPFFSEKKDGAWVPFIRRLAPTSENQINRPPDHMAPPFWCFPRFVDNLQRKERKTKSGSVLAVNNNNKSETPNENGFSEEEALRVYRESIAAILKPQTSLTP